MLRQITVALTLAAITLGSVDAAPSQKKRADEQPPTENSSGFKVRVKPIITMQHGPSNTSLKECLFRELGRIPAVVVVQDDDQFNRFEIVVVVVPIDIPGNPPFGYAAAVDVNMPMNRSALEDSIVESEFKESEVRFLSSARILEAQYAMTNSRLDGLCKDIAATFDTDHVEKVRQLMQKLQQPQQ